MIKNKDFDIVKSLQDINCIQKGEFILKNGEKSDTYYDMRLLVSYPTIMGEVALEIASSVTVNKDEYDYVVGVPTGAVPLATMISFIENKPQLIVRKEVKDYGTKKEIEGAYDVNNNVNKNRVLLIEDVVTTGSSILETIEKLKKYKLDVVEIWSIVDRRKDKQSQLINSLIKVD